MSPRPAGVAGRFPLLLVGGWLAAAYLLVPLIHRFFGWSPGGDLGGWFRFALWPPLAALVYAAYSALSARRRIVEHHVLGATATSLAGIRLAVCTVALWMVVREPLSTAAALPAELRRTEGVLALLLRLPRLGSLLDAGLSDAAALAALQGVAVLLLVAALLGWRTRWTLPAATVAYFLVQAVPRLYSRDYHSGLVPLYLLAVLSVTPCADALSLDRRRDPRGPPPEVPRAVYGWSRWACWTVMAATYFLAALSKLRAGGLDWGRAENLRAVVMHDWLQPMSVDLGAGRGLLHAPDAVFAGLGVGALLFELAYPAVLASRRARRVLPALAVLLHLGILVLQNVAFPDMILLQVLFYDARRWLPGRRPPRAAAVAEIGEVEVEAAERAPSRRAVRVLVAAWLVVWLFDVEAYPSTSFPMYEENRRSGMVVYDRVWERDAAGAVKPVSLGDALPLLGDGRWRTPLAGLFGDGADGNGEGRRRAEALLRAAAARRHPSPSAYVVERYLWNVDADPQGLRADGPPDGRGGRLPGRLSARVEVVVAPPRRHDRGSEDGG